jgi:LPS export ABC transporter protein LptC
MGIIKNIIPGAAIIFFLLSCENDIEKINELTSELKLPDQSGYNVEVTYSDSGKFIGKLYTPELNKYSGEKEPYIEFPEGIKVIFYDNNEKFESYIRSDYAIYYERKELWEIRNDVVARNVVKGEQLNTEQLFWDQNLGIIYSDKFSKIVNDDGTFYGENGFEAKEDLSKWKLKGSKGTVNVSDEQ